MSNNRSLLFRGVSRDSHHAGSGLEPKKPGAFEFSARSGATRSGQGWRSGTGAGNATLRHQLHQEGYPTSGVSTTPVYDRARFYATRGGKVEGYVYTIDRSLLNQHEIRVFVVADIVLCPSVPEDLEVILVAADGGRLSPEVVVSIDHVPA